MGDTPADQPATTLQRFCEARGLRLPSGLVEALSSNVGEALKDILFNILDADPGEIGLEAALERLDSGFMAPPDNYLPLMAIDDMSIACVACHERSDGEDQEKESTDAPSEVVRWHLGAIPEDCQGDMLDTDVVLFLRSVREERAHREANLRQIETAAQRFHEKFVARKWRPQAKDERPIQLACQNVIVGLATMQQDARHDALRVRAFAATEAPHLASQEGARALAAILLCDAFQNGGTMEIRFGPAERERSVPPALTRFARTRGFELGVDEACSISPAEARDLFMAVTPMRDDLRMRISDLIGRGVIAPERACFVLMSGIWSELELDYLAATSSRVASILAGGASHEDRSALVPELESCRAAIMAGMLQRRLDNADGAAAGRDGVRVFEDAARGVAWSILDEAGAVFLDIRETPIPWTAPGATSERTEAGLIVVPRGLPTPLDVAAVDALRAQYAEQALTVKLVVPADVAELLPADADVLVCPDRLSDLDAQIEKRWARTRVGRA